MAIRLLDHVRPLTDHEFLVAKERRQTVAHHARIAKLRSVAAADKAASNKAAEKLRLEAARLVASRKVSVFQVASDGADRLPWLRRNEMKERLSKLAAANRAEVANHDAAVSTLHAIGAASLKVRTTNVVNRLRVRTTTEAAERRSIALRNNLVLIAKWECEEGMEAGTCDVGAMGATAATATLAASSSSSPPHRPAPSYLRPRSAARPAASDAPTPSAAARPRSASALDDRGTMGALLRADLITLSRRLGGRKQLLADAVKSLPPAHALPPRCAADMRRSLSVVVHALTHKLHLEASEGELEAARVAFTSWHAQKWVDPRSGTVKSKPPFGWTIEQYGLVGFSALYAKKLHVPRCAHAYQITLWLLQCAPGVCPSHAASEAAPAECAPPVQPVQPVQPLTIADLGAGTCAACLGAWLALREHGGEEQPYRVIPADVVTSGERFANAFRAMTKPSIAAHGHQPLLPLQDAGQYIAVTDEGIEELARAVLAPSRPAPHLLLASFSLQYLDRTKRSSFFTLLASLATRPMLLIVIKGVGDTERPPIAAVHSTFFGVHYVIGADRNPRVVEAHLCLILPSRDSTAALVDASVATVAGASTATVAGASNGHVATGISGAPSVTSGAPSVTSGAPSVTEETTDCGSSDGGHAPVRGLSPVPDARDAPCEDRWVLQTYATVARRCKRDGLRTGVTLLD